ncbi:MAG: SAM-dependent chlorinase/fluorinase [Crenarchaeota archaeon]|nr:SAM-dependent chlorinase/fluorinase [Thermoproteota archaeon]
MLALITDYGYKDVYAGILRVVAKEKCPRTEVVDITHGVAPFDVLEGAVAVLVTLPHLPEGSTLVAVVDPGVGSAREAVAAEVGSWRVVAPNNGLLWLAAEEYGLGRAVRIEKRLSEYSSHTFHGRDLFVPAGAYLECGGQLEELGPETGLVPLSIKLKREVGPSYVRATAVYIDRFGNVMTWSKEAPFEPGQRVRVNGLPAMFVRTFSEVRPGELAVYFNSFGYLEVAVYMGSAAERLGLKPGDEVVVEA